MIPEKYLIPHRWLPSEKLQAPVMTYHAMSGRVYIIASNRKRSIYTLYKSNKYYSHCRELKTSASISTLINSIEKEYEANALSELRADFPEGTRVKLIYMHDEDMPEGLMGTVIHVDSEMQIHVRWENGSSLALQPDKDLFECI